MIAVTDDRRRRREDFGVGGDPLEERQSSSSWQLGDERSTESGRQRWPRAVVSDPRSDVPCLVWQ